MVDAPELEPVYRLIAGKICHMRQILGVSQEDLAKRAGMSRPSIVNMETGRQRISMHMIERIAAALGTSPKAMMKGIWW